MGHPNSPLSRVLQDMASVVTQHSPWPMVAIEEADYIIRYCNPAFCLLVSKSNEQLVGRPFDLLLSDKDECLPLIKRVFLTKKYESYTERDPERPHSVFWSYTIWPVTADSGFLGIMLQVTETAEIHEDTVAMNEALILGSLRQHELTEAAEDLNERLRLEVSERKQSEMRQEH